MTDVLLERFDALADPTDDSDWLDVRRRARRGRVRIGIAAAACAAAVAVAAAVAAGGGWLFNTHDRQVTATTSVSLNGTTWQVSITSGTFGRVCFHIAGASAMPTKACSGRLGDLHQARPFGAVSSKVPGGEIWVGATIGFARQVAITNTEGRTYAVDTAAAPKGTKSPFRYWAVAIAGTGKSITASDTRGHSIRKSLVTRNDERGGQVSRASTTPRMGSVSVSE